MHLGFSFRQTMSGSYWRLDQPAEERAIAFAVDACAPDVGALGRDKTMRLSGTVDVEQLATRKRIEGLLSFKLLAERRIGYRLEFCGDDGRHYELSGQQQWSGFSPIQSLTLLSSSLYEQRGEEIGRATLRFDIRADWAEWLKSFRLRLAPG
jgi:hypothetical protein